MSHLVEFEITMITLLTAWKNSALGKTKPWSRTKSQQKVWNRRPTSERLRELDEDNEQNNVIRTADDGMKI